MNLPANRIAKLRDDKNLTRNHLAVLCEVGEATIRRWERGESSVPDLQKFRLADFFDVDPAYLMGWDREPAGEPV